MESTDKLNHFIDENREQFDCFEPSPQLWKDIQAKQFLQHKKHVMLRTFMRVAAAVIILCGTYIALQKSLALSHLFVTKQNDSTVMMQISEFNEAQTYYGSEIKNKLETLKHSAKNYPDILNDTYTELQSLDVEYQKLQNDLQDGVQNTEVVSAMIQNYKYKLEILDKINEVINEQEAHKNALHHDI